MRSLLLPTWCLAVTASLGGLATYSSAPSFVEEVATTRFEGGSLDRFTLIVGVHPRCACTLATASQLERLLTRIDARVDCVVYVFAPHDAEDFTETLLVERFRAMPSVRVELDRAAARCREYGLSTSGAVALFAPGGERVFSGGLSPSRGHEGACLGTDAVADIVLGRTPEVTQTAVYGCRIYEG